MKWLVVTLTIVVLFLAAPVSAQEFVGSATTGAASATATPAPETAPVITSGTLAPTPEMWFYQQYQQQQQDPQLALRRAAEARKAARVARIESRRWYGISKARPVANPSPYLGLYSPGWVGGNAWDPYSWSGGSTVVVTPTISYR